MGISGQLGLSQIISHCVEVIKFSSVGVKFDALTVVTMEIIYGM
jgi:hypothetical protein